MPITIGRNIAGLFALRQLGRASDSLARTSEALASGLRINHASDDAAGLALASSLKNDAAIRSQGARNLSDGISLLNVGEAATSALVEILTRLKELAEQSANGTYSTTQRQALDSEAQALVDEHNRIISTTSFNGQNIFALDQVTLQAGVGENNIYSITLGSQSTTVTGDGTFSAATSQNIGSSLFVADNKLADLNGDGALDLVVRYVFAAQLDVLFGQGDGTFGSRVTYALPDLSSSVSLNDLDGDGDIDIVTNEPYAHQVTALLNNGSGSFGAPINSASQANANAQDQVATADFNGDGNVDVVLTGEDTSLQILFGQGNGSFTAGVTYATYSYDLAQVRIGDVDNDGDTDIITAGINAIANDFQFWENDGAGGLTKSNADSNPVGKNDFLLQDVNGDGNLDIVAATSNAISVSLGDGTGTFTLSVSYNTGTSIKGLALADVNGDGFLDLFGADGTGIAALYGTGSGTFGSKTALSITGSSTLHGVMAGDLNGDGALDLTALNEGGGTDYYTLLGHQTTTTVSTRINPISGISLATQVGAQAALTDIDTYLQSAETIRSTFGAAISRVQVGLRFASNQSALLLEAANRITDVDVASAVAEYVRQQILQNAATSILAQINQHSSLALKLLNDV